MTKQTNNTDRFNKYISESSKRMTNKQREELRDVIGTGHGYTTKDTDDIHIGLDLGSGESFSVSQHWRSDTNV
ncbi:hypothetical protein [Brochothrix thermosphacta]|uniref:hypothetical protein n=1 Tax=Brochothrix thermosphacta TaxID=2756 RepID=UPI000D79B74E|nr:hypothetical protein [Brochothrix thermosphacta]SPN76616.1 conserved hypothetical protein [Brochothrix thermosphacta]